MRDGGNVVSPLENFHMANRRSRALRQRCIDAAMGETLIFAEEYDAAILGIGYRDGVPVVVYDAEAVITILRERDGMERDEAEEFFDYNVQGAWIGESTPLFVTPVQ